LPCGWALLVAKADGAEAWDRLSRFGQRLMTMSDSAPSGDQAGGRRRELLKRAMAGYEACAGNASGVNHAPLQLRQFGERGFDAFLDGADLGCDFECGVLNLMLAHDCSFPRDEDRPDVVAEM
jgi:hypothetical protein